MTTGDLGSLSAGLIERVVARLRALEPAAVGVLVTGSYARGTATPWSDLDLTVLTAVEPVGDYRTWFEPRADRPLHVSAGACSLAHYAARGQEPTAWNDWSLGFPTDEAACFVWATDAVRAVLGDPPVTRRPGGSAELEDFVETTTKVRRAVESEDWLGARWHAADIGRRAPGLLRQLNPERRVRDRREALEAALDLLVAPDGYRADLLLSLGLAQADDETVAAAALRLARNLLAFVRERQPDVDPQPEIGPYLADGTLERHAFGG